MQTVASLPQLICRRNEFLAFMAKGLVTPKVVASKIAKPYLGQSLKPSKTSSLRSLVGFFAGIAAGLLLATAVGEWVRRIPVPAKRAAEMSMDARELMERRRNAGWNPNDAMRYRGPHLAVPTTGRLAGASAGAPFVNQGDVPPYDALPAGPENDDRYEVFVQAADFADATMAEDLRAKFASIGVTSIVSTRGKDGERRYRVRLGPFQDAEAALGIAEVLETKGLEPALIRVER